MGVLMWGKVLFVWRLCVWMWLCNLVRKVMEVNWMWVCRCWVVCLMWLRCCCMMICLLMFCLRKVER